MLQLLKNNRFYPLFLSHLLSMLSASLIQGIFLFVGASVVLEEHFIHVFTVCACYFFGFFLFAPLLGRLSDKYKQADLIRFGKAAEVILSVLCYLGFQTKSLGLLMVTVFCLGIKSGFLRILTYSFYADTLRSSDLLRSNIWIKSGSYIVCFIAVMCGVKLGETAIFPLFMIATGSSILALLSAFKIPQVKAQDPNLQMTVLPSYNLWEKLFDRNEVTGRYLLGIAWLWMVGGVLVYFFKTYTEDMLFSDAGVIALLSGVFAFAFCVGSYFLAKREDDDNLSFFVPFSLFFASLFFLDFSIGSSFVRVVAFEMTVGEFLKSFGNIRLLLDVAGMGIAFALYTIPLYTLLQDTISKKMSGQIFAVGTLLNGVGVMVGLIIAVSLLLMSFPLGAVYGIFALMSLAFSFYMFGVLSETKKRIFFKTVLRHVFKVKIEGLENVQKAGEHVLILANHTSYLDALLIAAFVPETITFFVNEKIAAKKWLFPLFSLLRVRPLDPNSPYAVREMVADMKDHRLCMYFTDGEIYGGHADLKMYSVPALVAQKAHAKILPILIKGASHSVFSRIKKRDYWMWFPKISLKIYPAFALNGKGDVQAQRKTISIQVYDTLTFLSAEMKDIHRTVFEATIDAMSYSGRFKKIIEDTARKPVKYQEMLMNSFVVGRLLKKELPRDKSPVGILLPTANVTVFAMYGLMSFGRVPAMLNFSSGIAQIIAACKTVGITTVVSAQKVITLGKLEPIVEALEAEGIKVLRLEHLMKKLTLKKKLFGLMGLLFPRYTLRFMQKGMTIKSSDPATILFTSGSEGFPKAVFLSHENILSDSFYAASMVDVYSTDVLLNILPMFHSFGLVAATYLPLVHGIKAVFYPTPLHYRIIPELCNSVKATIMFGTDTFLAGYAKCAHDYDFNTLRLVFSGAEKVKEETRRVWGEKFGVRILEGYGATECSPVISLNTPLFNKIGSVGRLIPGMEYKLEEVEGIKDGQEMILKGDNVMLGYMRFTDPLKLDPPANGWYDTGDIVTVDEEGFIFIKGRTKRFAKIGGEMVSLTAVETLIGEAWNGFVHGIVSVPDPKKGEQLVLVTTCSDITVPQLTALFKEKKMPEISIPKKIVFTIEPPLLGSGKFNYMKAKEMVLAEQ